VIDKNDSSDQQENIDLLYNAISNLNEVEKAIVMLYLDDKSYEEMEEILGISKGTLRVKMNRIKEKLRQFTKTS
jgi:RNA polymerase sigma-70 factor (ECF subfamily)